MRKTGCILVVLLLSAMVPVLRADKAQPNEALARLPVKEVTIFKDGHAFVLHEGTLPTDADGNVVMDYLPTPVLGTFWPFSADKVAKLSAVVASQRKVQVSRTALNLRELVEANVGAQVVVTEAPVGGSDKAAPVSYPAVIQAVPSQSGEELEAAAPPNTGEKLPVKGSIVLLKTDAGVRAVNIDRIIDITFKNAQQPKVASEEFRNLLKLKLDWQAGARQPQAAVGMVYLQYGLRWIPSYRLNIDGKGSVVVELEGTLINELADLQDVTANLVIGVPSFAFKDQTDPIALQQTLAQVAAGVGPRTQLNNAFSNAIMTQQAAMFRDAEQPARGPAADLGPEVAGSAKNEDLFIFTVQHITLKKGQRLVMPVAKYELKYRDVYTVDIPFAPPPEMQRQGGDYQRQLELAKLLGGPKAWHKLRLQNTSANPLTTAPALILRDNHVIAQGMMTYTPLGGTSDLELTVAVDVQVKKTDKETQRTPNAVTWNGDQYGRVGLTGQIMLTSFAAQPIEVEVRRNVLGNVSAAGQDGKVEMVNVFEDREAGPSGDMPAWWSWYNWPYWWGHFNGVGRVDWKLTLPPNTPTTLTYEWHYYWR